MTFQKYINKQNLGLLGTIVSGLMIGIPAISLPASAKPDSDYMSIAYCPGVYIEFAEAYNETDIRRCPLSAEELRLREERQIATEQNSTTNFDNRTNDIQPSLFEDRQNSLDRTTTGDFENRSSN